MDEERLTDLESRIAVVEASNKRQEGMLKEVRDVVMELKDDWSRSKGLVTGVILTVSTVWAVLVTAWGKIQDFFTGG